jgi:pimeloyl-ACP methyl ester carboxylesterase
LSVTAGTLIAAAAALFLAAGLSACTSSEKETAMKTVTLTASDGVAIEADVAGSGTVGVVLAHGLKFLDGKGSFRDELLFLGSHGVTALAISFRGYPAQKIPPITGGRDRDLLAAVSFLEEGGCDRVFVLGSSMGGYAALRAAEALKERDAFAGMILISAGDAGGADGVACPKLFVVAEDDARMHESVTAMHRTAPEPKRLVVFKEGGHGQALFASHSEELLETILAFVTGTGK